MRLLIAVPAYETLRAEFVQSLMELTAQLNQDNVPHEVKILTGSLVYAARDKLAQHAVNNHFDEVLWIDSDMVFDRHLYEDLSIHGKDMICGWFVSRHSPYVSCLFSSIDPVERISEPPDDIFRVEGCGFGAVLMKAKVLEDVMNGNRGKCFLPEAKAGEDLAFCRRATGCGYAIWCDPTVRVGHVGNLIIWPEDRERLLGDIRNLDGKTIE